MSISFSCNFCSRKYRVDEALAGRKVQCKECGTDLTIPSAEAVALTDSDLAPKATPAHRELYGLDDEDGHAPPPPPRRPGMRPAPTSSGDWSRKPSQSPFSVLRMVGILALVIGVVTIKILIGVGLARREAPPAQVAMPPRFAPPNFPQPNVPPPNFAAPAPQPGQAAPGIHVTLSSGKSSPVYSPIGTLIPGVSFRAEYHMTGQRPPNITRYVTVVTGPRARATSMFDILQGSGTVGGKVTTMSQSDGPFEMYIEAETFGQQRHKVSESIPLPWDNTPPPQRGIPQPPNFGQPPGFPNNPNNRRPGLPNIPRFGPRGRM